MSLKSVKRATDGLINELKEEKRFLILYLIAGCIVYFLMMSLGLFNHYDGLWHPSRYYASDWEFSIGRWAWPFLDKLRFGLVSAPMNTMISLLFTGLGHAFLFRLFGIKNDLRKLLISLIWISSSVFCMSLSYVYMSTTFAASFLFAVAAAYALIRFDRAAGLLLSSCFFALSMGFYQAYTGVTCLIMCAYFIVLCSKREEMRDIAKYCIRTVGMVLCGGVLYFLATKVCLRLKHISLDQYGGASSVSPAAILRNLPNGIKMCYMEFYKFFATSKRHNNYFKENHLTVLLFAVLAVLMAVCLINVARKSIRHAVLMAVGAVLLPVAANFVLLIATESTYIKLQMSSGMAMMPGVLLCMTCLAMAEFAPKTTDKKLSVSFASVAIITVLTALLAWVQVCSVTNDQLAMEEGRTSVTTIANMIAEDLKDQELITAEEKLCIIGIPSKNDLFYKYRAWNESNGYAKFGQWSTSTDCDFYSWRSTYRYLCGLSLNFCSSGDYRELMKTEEVKEMPNYPEEGSIRKIGDFIVVKVSNKY